MQKWIPLILMALIVSTQVAPALAADYTTTWEVPYTDLTSYDGKWYYEYPVPAQLYNSTFTLNVNNTYTGYTVFQVYISQNPWEDGLSYYWLMDWVGGYIYNLQNYGSANALTFDSGDHIFTASYTKAAGMNCGNGTVVNASPVNASYYKYIQLVIDDEQAPTAGTCIFTLTVTDPSPTYIVNTFLPTILQVAVLTVLLGVFKKMKFK